jgi:ABC-type antimicrobial peptide transport system permease subunit
MLLLAGLLALGAAAITHVLLVSVTSHRRDVAVLRAIGFTRGQSGVAVMVHATFLATVACAVGIPIGLLLGRIAWAQIAASLYVVPRPIVPALLVALLAVLLAGVANLASILPAMRAMRLEPATILHTD